ncbi:MAG: TonB-dependent receptor [Novosphingobium sp.]|nr:TonB-dependent receptor [Novosphingobium sp.]
MTAGSYGYYRALAAGSARAGEGDLLAAIESTLGDGPWVLDEDLRKLNALVKYSTTGWSLGLSGYASRWTSTDQAPERAVASGLIPRRGFIDADVGGKAGRLALTFNAGADATRISAYAIVSRLRLTSNFTYFLDDPVSGDEFRQADRRAVFGGALRHQGRAALGAMPLTWRLGGDVRFDRIGRVGLYRSIAGAIASTVREDRVDEYGGGLFGELEAALSPALRLVLGLRADAIGYRVRADLAANSGKGSDAILTPKAALAWRVSRGVELYANYGEGFHSNDVRGATIRIDPASGAPADRVPVFARSRGYELGVRVEHDSLSATLVGFGLDLASELVFVGDAGATEPNAATRRHGGEATLFWRPAATVTLDAAAALTRARFRGVAPGEGRIPGAVRTVLAGGISAEVLPVLTLTARVRHFGSAPLIEDNSARSDPTTLVNAGAYWDRGRLRLSAELLNAFDAKDADITYFYASRLSGEPAEGIEDRHLHPVEKRQLRVSARLAF